MAEIEYEFQVEIGDIIYGMDTLSAVTIKQPLFDKIDVGLACCAQMTVSYYVGDIPEPARGAKLIPRCRARGSNDPWFQLGVFYIDLRVTRSGKQTLTCYDSMMMADVKYLDQNDDEFLDDWPRSMRSIVNDIVERMGISLDPRTVINEVYTIDYPNEKTMRNLLQYVAAAHAGNWIITAANQLLLVPLATSMPAETYYLVDEYGQAIVFGVDRILVERVVFDE